MAVHHRLIIEFGIEKLALMLNLQWQSRLKQIKKRLLQAYNHQHTMTYESRLATTLDTVLCQKSTQHRQLRFPTLPSM